MEYEIKVNGVTLRSGELIIHPETKVPNAISEVNEYTFWLVLVDLESFAVTTIIPHDEWVPELVVCPGCGKPVSWPAKTAHLRMGEGYVLSREFERYDALGGRGNVVVRAYHRDCFFKPLANEVEDLHEKLADAQDELHDLKQELTRYLDSLLDTDNDEDDILTRMAAVRKAVFKIYNDLGLAYPMMADARDMLFHIEQELQSLAAVMGPLSGRGTEADIEEIWEMVLGKHPLGGCKKTDDGRIDLFNALADIFGELESLHDELTNHSPLAPYGLPRIVRDTIDDLKQKLKEAKKDE